MKRAVLLFSLLLTIYLLPAQTRIDGTFPFMSDPAKQYSIYVPSGYNPNTPNQMMLGLHPLNTSRWNSISWCDTLKAFAETYNLLLICPDGGADGRIDDPIDTAFTSVILDSMEVWYNVNTERVYAMGFSWGGRTTYTYGLFHHWRIKGLIPIGAAINGTNEVNAALQSNAICKPVYIIHGANDIPNTRFFPVRTAMLNAGAILKDTLMSGIGHTIDFPNRNAIMGRAYLWVDSVNTAPLQVDAGNDTVTCSGSGIVIGGSPTARGGQCPYTYTWTPGGSLSSTTVANPMASPGTGTSYILTVTDARGASASDTIFVDALSLPSLALTPDTMICPGASTPLQVSGAMNYNWSPSLGLSCTNCANPLATPNSTTSYIVTGTGANGCAATDTVSVGLLALPATQVTASAATCQGDSVLISASAQNSSVVWSPSTGLNCSTCPSPMASPASNTTYTVTFIFSNGCTSVDSVPVTVNANPVVPPIIGSAFCIGDSVLLMASGGAFYNWTPTTGLSDPNSATPMASPADTTTYTVLVTSQQGCSASTQVTLNPMPAPSVSFTHIANQMSVDFTDGSSMNVIGWAWDFGDGGGSNVQDPSHIYSNPGTYWVCLTGTDNQGCQNTHCDSVTILPLGLGVDQYGLVMEVRSLPAGGFLLNFPGGLALGGDLEIYALDGKQLIREKLAPGPVYRFENGSLADGVYLLRVKAGDRIGMQKAWIRK